jgi:hypothetical protein
MYQISNRTRTSLLESFRKRGQGITPSLKRHDKDNQKALADDQPGASTSSRGIKHAAHPFEGSSTKEVANGVSENLASRQECSR